MQKVLSLTKEGKKKKKPRKYENISFAVLEYPR